MLKPTGVLSVTRVAPNAVEGLVLEVYDGVRTGDFVRPAPLYDLVPGQYPDVVTNRTEATIIEFGQFRQVYGLKQVAMLNKGSRDGVAIGDEYVTFWRRVDGRNYGTHQGCFDRRRNLLGRNRYSI